jgi:uncharacterized small protein (DUF1192 family)
MQESILNPSHWLQTALTIIASLVTGGGIVKFYTTWLNRRRPAAEINVAQATATEITVRAGSTAGDAVVRMLARLDIAQETIDRLRSERDAWQDQYDQVFVQRDQLTVEVSKLKREVAFYDEEIKRMNATLTMKRLNYDGTQDMPITPPKES